MQWLGTFSDQLLVFRVHYGVHFRQGQLAFCQWTFGQHYQCNKNGVVKWPSVNVLVVRPSHMAIIDSISHWDEQRHQGKKNTHCWAVPEDLCFSWPTSRAVPPWSRWWPSVAWPVPGTGSDRPGTAAPGTTSHLQTKDVLFIFARGEGWERGWEIKFCSNTLMMWDNVFYKACQFIYICNWDKLLKPLGLKNLSLFILLKRKF